jgi:MarR family transcriptional regulator, transcriptional regulator for hemolysin
MDRPVSNLAGSPIPVPAQEPRLAQLLVDAVRLLRKDFYQRTQGLKVTPALTRLLFDVAREPGSTQVDIAARLEITPVTLSRMLDRLVKCRYLCREADPEDRRVFRVFVDRAGEPLVGQLHQLGELTAARAMKGLSDREQAALLRHLTRICANLSSGVA